MKSRPLRAAHETAIRRIHGDVETAIRRVRGRESIHSGSSSFDTSADEKEDPSWVKENSKRKSSLRGEKKPRHFAKQRLRFNSSMEQVEYGVSRPQQLGGGGGGGGRPTTLLFSPPPPAPPPQSPPEGAKLSLYKNSNRM